MNRENGHSAEESQQNKGFMSNLAKKARGLVAAAGLLAGGEAMAGGPKDVQHGKQTRVEVAGQKLEVDEDGLIVGEGTPDSLQHTEKSQPKTDEYPDMRFNEGADEMRSQKRAEEVITQNEESYEKNTAELMKMRETETAAADLLRQTEAELIIKLGSTDKAVTKVNEAVAGLQAQSLKLSGKERLGLIRDFRKANGLK
jgi:hypothetical protein